MNGSSSTTPWVRRALFAIAGICVAGGAFRAFVLIRRGEAPDQDVLLFFVAAVVAMLAESITKFSFAGLEFERLKQQVDEITDVAMTQGAAVRPGPATEPAQPAEAPTVKREHQPTLEERARGIEASVYSGNLGWEDDPVANRSATSRAEGATLEADVTPSATKAGVFKVDVRCVVPRRLLAEKRPRVAFFLHHMFPNRVRVLPVDGDTARLSLWSAGTFTIGALLPDGVWLTLDLADANLSALSRAQREAFLNG
ncbi:MAG TPA: pYEATS domain-containing protein [Vicinamibacterales bacterium]|nr:pYEATS domain-containing protein [Vicinamibacterales bacterium]